MIGHFAVLNEWARIAGELGGDFLERCAPGSFVKTLARDRSSIRCLYAHGRDPYVGSKPLGVPDVLREDERGAYFEVPLLADALYVRELLPGLEAGAYGASFRFKVLHEEWADNPGRSAYNEDGIPERSIFEAKVYEFGPVPFAAYAGATAGLLGDAA